LFGQILSEELPEPRFPGNVYNLPARQIGKNDSFEGCGFVALLCLIDRCCHISSRILYHIHDGSTAMHSNY
jgi:hypothetical protein